MPSAAGSVDRRALVAELAGAVGARHTRTDADSLAPLLVDERGRYHGEAIAAVWPADTASVATVVRLCAAAGVAVVPQGGNTGLCGGATPRRKAPSVVLSLRRMREVRHIDRLGRSITVGAGATVAEVADAAASAGMLFPLSFGAEGTAQIGGALSTNAGGTNVLRYGSARAFTLGLEVVLADGRVARLGRGLRKDNTGYDLKHLFVGSEGTLGVICEATLALYPLPRQRATAMATVAGPAESIELLARLQEAADGRVSTCEWMSPTTRRLACEPPGGARDPFGGGPESLILVELTSGRAGDETHRLLEEVLAEALEAGIIGDAAVADSSAAAERLWQVREAPPAAEKRAGGSIKHDLALQPARAPEFVERAVAAVGAVLPGVQINAFGHLGDGNIHFNLLAPKGEAPEVLFDKERPLTAAVFDAAEALGGSFSAEHGIGQRWRHELARRKHPVALDLMHRIKATLDPEGILNPGKVL
ncbi:MAG: FAD-binding oxidoreductase [Acidimicrobiia bacterium]|nr:FAD-binding oxidoreductase [Acidimicrobiia bacterium]